MQRLVLCLPFFSLIACDSPNLVEGGANFPGPALPDSCSDATPYYPAPRYLAEDTRGCLPVTRACLTADAADRDVVTTALTEVGIAFATDDVCEWRIEITAVDTGLATDLRTRLGNDTSAERFAVETRVDNGVATTLVVTPDRRALRHAVRLLGTRVRRSGTDRAVARGLLFDRPSFPVRGIIEGFYGDPYSIAERKTLLGLMAQLGMNTYVYGPKGDSGHRVDWRVPYTGDIATALRTLVTDAHALGIEPIWAVSPAWDGGGMPMKSIRYSSEADFAVLTAKLDDMRTIGFSRFALFVDDIAPSFYYAEDNTAFSSVAAGHASLANRMLAYVRATDPAARLYFVGRDYSEYQTTWKEYNTVLGAELDDGIDVLWTGPLVYSPKITTADCEKANQLLGRKVSIWDNHPEKVVAMSGRSGDLPTAVDGFFANPVMNEWRYHPVEDFWRTVGTLGVYMWNSESYDGAGAFAWWGSLPQVADWE